MLRGSARSKTAPGDPKAEQLMHVNGMYAKLSQALAETESRLVARLDALEAKLDRLLERGDPQPQAPAAPPKPKKAG